MFSKHGMTADGLQPLCKDCVKARRTIVKYKLTAAQIVDIKSAQGNLCPICDGSLDRWAIDHDHSCCPGTTTCGNCVRGIICQNCNNGLGMFKDAPSALRKAADYLEARK